MPLVRIGRWLGHGNMDRVYGPDLMHHLCKMSVKKGYTHCLYGGKSQYQAQTIPTKTETTIQRDSNNRCFFVPLMIHLNPLMIKDL
jgi:Teichoic acid biosynthesis proteins